MGVLSYIWGVLPHEGGELRHVARWLGVRVTQDPAVCLDGEFRGPLGLLPVEFGHQSSGFLCMVGADH